MTEVQTGPQLVNKRRKNTEDERGSIRIVIYLSRKGAAGAQKGNITKSFTVRNSTVSEVEQIVGGILESNCAQSA